MPVWTYENSTDQQEGIAVLLGRLRKPLVFLVCLIPFAYLLFLTLQQQLGANPVERLLHETGLWGLRFLLIVLLMTPLRRFTGWQFPLQIRRMLGLFAFFYVTLHFSVYLFLDLQLDWSHVAEDIAKRPFITIGFSAFVLLIPLAVTSNRYSMRKLGRRWKKLHRLVYPIAIAGVVHFIWLVKKDIREPMIYMAILAVLLLLRVDWKKRVVSVKQRT